MGVFEKVTIILLGSDFMFNEELGSRLRGVGYSIKTFSSKSDLENIILENIDLVVIDLEKRDLGGLETMQIAIQNNVPVLALTQHRSTELANKALELGAKMVIFNSQASKNIEKYVSDILKKLKIDTKL